MAEQLENTVPIRPTASIADDTGSIVPVALLYQIAEQAIVAVERRHYPAMSNTEATRVSLYRSANGNPAVWITIRSAVGIPIADVAPELADAYRDLLAERAGVYCREVTIELADVLLDS